MVKKATQPPFRSFVQDATVLSDYNSVLIFTDLDDALPAIIFHPFIESFKHTLTPKINEEQFGLYSITTYYRSGVAKNTYEIGLALPSVDDSHAKDNYLKVLKLKKLADPKLVDLQNETGQVKLQVGHLIPDEYSVGYITAVDETMVVDQGFSKEGYPKLLRLSFTFAVDEIYRSAHASAADPPAAITKPNNPTTDKPAASVAEAARDRKRKTTTGGAAADDKPKKPPCPPK